MSTENKKLTTSEQSQAITETIKTNPLKHAVAPKKASLWEAIEMWEKLKYTANNQVSVGLDKFEEKLARQRKVDIQ